MQRLLYFTVFLVLLSIHSFSQVSLEHTYYGNATAVVFSSNGEKIVTSDTAAIQLYNMDHTLWKTITAPAYAGYNISYVYAVSDNLFNSDDLVEAVVVYVSFKKYPTYKCQLINEAGTVLNDFDSADYVQVHYNETDNSYKLFNLTYVSSSSSHYNTSVYSLPGTMPCGKCSSLGLDRHASSTTPSIVVSEPVPNPSAETARISYRLPDDEHDAVITFYNAAGQRVRELPVSAQDNFININNKLLTPGAYTYDIKSGNVKSDTKVMVVK